MENSTNSGSMFKQAKYEKVNKGGRQILLSGFFRLGVTLADFPAVFSHISHWYLSWNNLYLTTDKSKSLESAE